MSAFGVMVKVVVGFMVWGYSVSGFGFSVTVFCGLGFSCTMLLFLWFMVTKILGLVFRVKLGYFCFVLRLQWCGV